MLLPWEIKCNITRAPVRSILIVCVSALIVCGMAMYLRNIQATEEALEDLGQRYPVAVCVTNRDGSLDEDLCIYGKDVDYLLESGVRDPIYTAIDFSAGGIGSIYGTNTLDSLEELSAGDFTFSDGWDESFTESRKPAIALREDIARGNDWQPGEKIFLEFSMLDRMADTSTGEPEIKPVGGYSVTLVAVYPGEPDTVGAVMPVDWLRGIVDIALPEGTFKYDSFCAVVEEPRELNAYKDAAEEWGFYQRSAVADPGLEGDALSIEDEMYIKTSGEMRESLDLYRTFLLPFFGMVASIMAMVTFLALRSNRRQIAIISSLGRPKLYNVAAHFCSAMIVQLTGCLLATLTLTLMLDLRSRLAGITIAAFSLCALGGTVLALVFLFRFDTLTLLTKDD